MATHSSFLACKSHGQRVLEGYSPQGHKESDTTEAHVGGLESFSSFFFSAAEVVVFYYCDYLHLGCWKLFFFESQFISFMYFYFYIGLL